MAPFSANLGGIELEIVSDGASLDGTPFEAVLANFGRSGRTRTLWVNRTGARTLQCHVRVEGASKDDAIAKLAAVNSRLRTGCDLTVRSRGATKSVTLKVMPSPPLAPSFLDGRFENANATLAALNASLEPYAYGDRVAIARGNYNLPDYLDIDVPGDFPTPLYVQIDQASGVDAIGRVHLGLFPDQSTAMPLWEAESLSWGSNASTFAAAAAHGGAAVMVSSGSAMAVVSDTSLPLGTYRVLARIGQSLAGTASFSTALGPGTDGSIAGYRLELWGTARLPFTAVRSGGQASSGFWLLMKPGTVIPYWDYFMLVPSSWGWASWEEPNGASNQHLVLDFDGRWYADDIASGRGGRSGGLGAVGKQRLIIAADTYPGSGRLNGGLSASVSIDAVPRYSLWA